MRRKQRHRNKIEVVYEILRHCEHPIAPSTMIQYANVSSRRRREYIRELCELGLIKRVPRHEGSNARYMLLITEKGNQVRGLLEEICNLLGGRFF